MPKIQSMLAILADILFPRACVACTERVAAGDPLPFCRLCAVSVEPLQPPYCLRCGQPFAGDGPNHACLRCSTHPPPFARARAPYLFGGSLLTALHRYKYGGAWELGGSLGALVAGGGYGDLVPTAFDLVVPVPVHRARLAQRGFDHVTPLARAVGRAGQVRMVPRALRRVRNTPPQVSLSGDARRRNVEGAFAVRDRRQVTGRRVLLVDDVLTTGATVSACSRALRGAGASQVAVLCLARAIP